MHNGSTFEDQIERIKLVTGKRTQNELADFFGVRQTTISQALRRGKVPSAWLVILARVKDVHPEWVLTGNGPCFVTGAAGPQRPETDEEALRRLLSRALADELVRRINPTLSRLPR